MFDFLAELQIVAEIGRFEGRHPKSGADLTARDFLKRILGSEIQNLRSRKSWKISNLGQKIFSKNVLERFLYVFCADSRLRNLPKTLSRDPKVVVRLVWLLKNIFRKYKFLSQI